MKRAVIYRGNRVWCSWTDEECNISNCSYASCARRQLLPGGVCGESVKRKTVERTLDDDLIPSVKLKGKALRKIGDKDFY
jgi:hypothetical protein